MIYPYACHICNTETEVTKSVKDIDNVERCEKCNAVMERFIAKSQHFYGASDWDSAHYNPAFGKVMKSNTEVRKEAKRLGMEEVGNEPVERIHKKFDSERAEKIRKRTDSIFDTSLGELKSG